jgi:hypothetical protein
MAMKPSSPKSSKSLVKHPAVRFGSKTTTGKAIKKLMSATKKTKGGGSGW